MYIIVIGCGRLGSNLAQDLSDRGHDVCVVDRDGERLDVLGNGFNGQRIKGIEFDADNLQEGGIERADALLAVSSDDNINITVSLEAQKIYHVPQIIARANDPGREYIYRALEIETISPVRLGAEILIQRLTAKNADLVLAENSEYEILEVFVGRGKPCSVGGAEQKLSCIISGIIRCGQMTLPAKEAPLRFGDKIICTVPKGKKEKLMQYFSREMALWNP